MAISSAIEFDCVMSVLVNAHIAGAIRPDPMVGIPLVDAAVRDLARRLIIQQFLAGVLDLPRQVPWKSREDCATELSGAMEIHNVAGSLVVNFRDASKLLFPEGQRARPSTFIQQLGRSRPVVREARNREVDEAVARTLRSRDLYRARDWDRAEYVPPVRVKVLDEELLAARKEAKAKKAKEKKDEADRKQVEDAKVKLGRKLDLD